MTTPSRQDALLIVTNISSGREQRLATILHDIDAQGVENNLRVPFTMLKTIHFARWAILPAADDASGAPIPAQLVFASNFDGWRESHLQDLVTAIGMSGLDPIYEHCEGYPTNPTPKTCLDYLQQHIVPHQAFYRGTPGRTVGQIQDENELHEAISRLLDLLQNQKSQMTDCQIRDTIRQHVSKDLPWANERPSPWASLPVRVVSQMLRRPVISRIASALLLALVVLPLAPFIVVLCYKESRDTPHSLVRICSEVSKLADKEDRIAQNQMTAVLNIKPGAFRLVTLKLVLATVNLLARFATDGFLGGIPSIHFARWAVIDDGRRLLFLSNFDGSWENYLDDFIDKAASGLTAIWSNTVGFPKTRWLFLKGGARDAQRFKAYARGSQVPTQVWYSAYKKLTVQNINNNSLIRVGLNGTLTEKELRHWLRRF